MTHIVKLKKSLSYTTPGEFVGRSSGYTSASIVDEPGGGVQMGFRVSRLIPDGHVASHVQSYEESLYVIEGALTIDTDEGSYELVAGDYGLVPVGMTHRLRNASKTVVEFAEMQAPLPRARFGYDTQFPDELPTTDAIGVDVRDPRNRYFGHIDPASMDPTLQTQDRLAVSASMRTALLVYSGITVKMMVDSDLGADLSTMFMVQYEQGGYAGAHDHPLEEAYLILEGEVAAEFDGEIHTLGPGDIAWAGVGCVHAFRNVGDGIVRWLETQAPQPPARHSYRFSRDWAYLENALAKSTSTDQTPTEDH
jgi:quercetin dioxygenase-like cupin family protein